jgi:hypothetical protein
MAIFPEDISPIYPYTIEPEWDTLVKRADSGAEQRRQKALYPRFNVRFQLSHLATADAQTIWDFFMARKGRFESFYYFDPLPDLGIVTTYDNLFIGTGDAATEVFNLPGKSTSGHVIYVDGVTQALTTDYVILTGGGDGSADRVDFVTPPADTESLSCDFTGKLRVNCRFAYDKMPRTLFMTILFSYGIEMTGLAGN